MDLSRVEERGEEWKTTGLETIVLNTAGNIEDSMEEDRRGMRAGWKITGWL